ncbi:putative P-loop containing nucleoside triphosphate hydrolase, leucine-rich repeat domain, L [Medicago truncatula]|uniref:Putative P-loop containing nucleoside triphosphate hydrolase, leucine-rich repeat domain, L n=1 Tax=Medicago truncatula TaxID=3880 RepID=A0A396IR59_MEDTR|nr:probable disease resistance protein At4g27220 [Medicago truncatula]RHN67148.1 putative P-loop containing nucleoside triphosphate hydrolase, leucine-rich repeat domain, L [Medicago truncatula]
MANIFVTIATNVGQYLAGPAIREVQYLLCVNNTINDLEKEKEALTSERDNLLIRVERAKERTEVIEKPVEKWLNDVEKLLREVEVLVQRTETDNNCFQGWFPTCGRYLLCKQMVQKIDAMGRFKGKSKDIEPFSHLAPLPGILYQSSEDFIYFESTKVAYDKLLKALEDDRISIIGLYGMGGCGKTTLVTEVGKKAEELDMFDKVISITVTRTPNIRSIQGQIADMLNLKLGEESEDGRAQRLWLRLKEMKRTLIIVDNLWREFHLKDTGIRLYNDNRGALKILVTTRIENVCILMNCHKMIHLGLLSKDESWTFFQKLAVIDDEFSVSLDGVPQEICYECKGLPLAIKTMSSSLKGKDNNEWNSTLAKLMVSKASDDHEGGESDALNCIKSSYECLQNREAEQIFLMCCMFLEDYHIPVEDLLRYEIGVGVGRTYSLQLRRSMFQAHINKLLDSRLLMHGSVKMHDMVRDTALWIANRSNNCKILVNVDKPLSIVAEDKNIRDCFAVSSWWENKNPFFCPLHAPNLKMLLLNISARPSLNSLDLSHLTFEGIQGLEVFSLTVDYRVVPISFSPSIQLLKNVRTLRLNGLNFGDISVIGSLTSLEVLDLRRCNFNELPIEIGKLISLKLLDLSECRISENNYNGAIGKCSQLEELYASTCYPEKYVHEIIIDIGILSNLQRFVFDNQILQEIRRVLKLKDFNISKLRTSKKNILQIAENISLEGLHGGCKNIIPDMVGIVGGMNDLTSLHLTSCQEIECIFDATYDFKEDDLIPRLGELRLRHMNNLTELYRGPSLQVLRYFEKLELVDIQYCWQVHIMFPLECKLRNLKILSLSNCRTDKVLFSESVAQSMLQLEQLNISGCYELKHIIAASGSQHGGSNTSEEISPAPMNSHFLMTKLRDVNISDCPSLESIFPICYVEGLTQLQQMEIEDSPKLEYVFGKCDHKEHLSSNHVTLPHLEALRLSSLENLIGMFPENCQANWSSQCLRMLNIYHCPKMAIPWFNLKVGYDQSQHHPNERLLSKLQELELCDLPQLYSISWVGPTPSQIWSFQCLQSLTVKSCENLKFLFSMGVCRSLPELISLVIENCQELEQVVVEDEELLQLPDAEFYFRKLKQIGVFSCNKLKSLFPFAMVTMLPQLSSLFLAYATQLQEVFRHSSGDNVMNEMEIVLPNLTKIFLSELPNFVDICHGCKLHAPKLLKLSISFLDRTPPSLIKIQRKLQEEAGSGDGEDFHSLVFKNDEDSQFRSTSSISDYVKDPSVPNLAVGQRKNKVYC